ncbi:hypothetical protein [Planctomycetes bacterium Pla163]|uniref:hypothetical protein n=1 Tax=Rohdeia mirabilis TaxID=2528008 RepID=UPI0011A6BF83
MTLFPAWYFFVPPLMGPSNVGVRLHLGGGLTLTPQAKTDLAERTRVTFFGLDGLLMESFDPRGPGEVQEIVVEQVSYSDENLYSIFKEVPGERILLAFNILVEGFDPFFECYWVEIDCERPVVNSLLEAAATAYALEELAELVRSSYAERGQCEQHRDGLNWRPPVADEAPATEASGVFD